MSLQKILDEIEERAAKATKGPWKWGGKWHDAIFISHSRDDVPRLVAALRVAMVAFQEQEYCDDREKLRSAVSEIERIMRGGER